MARNEGTIDRVLRIVAGLALVTLVFFGPSRWLGLIGFVLVFTGVVGFCPLYRLVGIHTTKTKPA